MAKLAWLALLGSYVALALAKHPLEDPNCQEPDREMADVEGEGKLRVLQTKGLKYDEALFEITEGDADALRSGAAVPFRILFKVPVHTCRIKLMPGVREWVTTHPDEFTVPIEVAPYSQPPNFNILADDSSLLLRVVVHDGATVADINNFLEAHGVHKLDANPTNDQGEVKYNDVAARYLGKVPPVTAKPSTQQASFDASAEQSIGVDL